MCTVCVHISKKLMLVHMAAFDCIIEVHVLDTLRSDGIVNRTEGVSVTIPQ